jgi:hypothetical protein
MTCCGSLFVNLGGGGGSITNGFLQTAAALNSTPQVVEDNLGNDSLLGLGTTKILLGIDTSGGSNPHTINIKTNTNVGSSLYSGTWFNVDNDITFSANRDFVFGNGATRNGRVTILGTGGNIASFRNSSNVEVSSISSSGNLIGEVLVSNNASFGVQIANGSMFYWGSRGGLRAPSNGIFSLLNTAENDFTRLQFGGTTSSYPAIASTNTPATLAAKDATGTNLIPFSAEDFTSGNLSTGTLITARPMQFGDKGTVTTGNDLGLDAQIAVEHNGAVYYIPCSTSLIT